MFPSLLRVRQVLQRRVVVDCYWRVFTSHMNFLLLGQQRWSTEGFLSSVNLWQRCVTRMMLVRIFDDDDDDDESCAGTFTADWAGDKSARCWRVRWTGSNNWTSASQVSQANHRHSPIAVGTPVDKEIQRQQPAPALQHRRYSPINGCIFLWRINLLIVKK